MNSYNPLMPKNRIYILKKDGEVYKIVGKKEDELPMKMIGTALEKIGKKEKINSKDLENAIKKVGGMGQ